MDPKPVEPESVDVEPSAQEDPQLERRRIDQICEPEFVANLSDLPLQELRARRDWQTPSKPSSRTTGGSCMGGWTFWRSSRDVGGEKRLAA